MGPISQALATCLLIGIWASACLGVEGGDAYLAEGGDRARLKEPLTLREEQGGIAGVTGTMWAVEPSGEWKVVKFRPGPQGTERTTTLRQGRLTPEQLVALADEMKAQDLAGMPAKLGGESKVNPHRYVLQFGAKKTMLTKAPRRREGEGVRENIMAAASEATADETEVHERFARLAHAVERCTADKAD